MRRRIEGGRARSCYDQQLMLPERLLETARKVVREPEALGADYRVIGGLAVHHHGYERSTKDIDLLVGHEDHARIRARLLEAGYLPSSPGGKKMLDAHTGVGIDFLIAGVDRPGSCRAPVSFPRGAGDAEDGTVVGSKPGGWT